MRLFNTFAMWGVTATPPSIETEHAQHLYLLLAREKAHHPNLLSVLVPLTVKCNTHTRDGEGATNRTLTRVRLTAEEMVLLAQDDTSGDTGDVVRRSTFIAQSVSPPEHAGIEEQFRLTRDRELKAIRAKAEGYERSIRILERAGAELEAEVARLEELSLQGDEFANAQMEVARDAYEAHTNDIVGAKQLWKLELKRVERYQNSEKNTKRRIQALHTAGTTCDACGTISCTVVSPMCAHVFCSQCVATHLKKEHTCPKCFTKLHPSELCEVANVHGIGTKMRRIGEFIVSLAASRSFCSSSGSP